MNENDFHVNLTTLQFSFLIDNFLFIYSRLHLHISKQAKQTFALLSLDLTWLCEVGSEDTKCAKISLNLFQES